jgi:seryl-tRNA synthetase
MTAPVMYTPYDPKDIEIYQTSLNQRDEEVQERWVDLTGNLSERNKKLLSNLEGMNAAYKDLSEEYQTFKSRAYTGIALSCCVLVAVTVFSIGFSCK